MKKVAVFFKQEGIMDYPFTKDEYLESYKELDLEIKNLGAEFYIVRDNTTYLGNGVFSNSWKFIDNQVVETGEIKIDVIYDKGEFLSDDSLPVLNSKFVNDVCTDKYKTYQMFKEFCPETILVNNEEEFENALLVLAGDKKVIKPLDGEEGNGVFIGDHEYLKSCQYGFAMLVQEFLDTSAGIPGIYVGIHDLRLVYINGEIIFSFYRTPPEGELLANISQGGGVGLIDVNNLPNAVLEISNIVKANFEGDYCFGIDIGFVDGTPKIIELNSRVGLQASSRGDVFVKFKKRIAELLVNMK
ncbi:MAG: ATP-grasp domain-containing protein [Candidatus Gracilibacteria bacterium]|nr:ATP-grasp domain-containing protein [Candidatus Gracilibacteria bacterium]